MIYYIFMKKNTVFLTVFLISAISPVLAQKISETKFELGFNKTFSSEYNQRWPEEYALPNFLNLKTAQSWYRNDRRISLQKEAGLNLQYSKISVGGGGLGAGNYYSGKIISLFADISLQMRIRIDSMISFGIGPIAEYLLTGYSKLNNSYYTVFTNPPCSGDISISGINRYYFNQPSFGVKLSIFNSGNGKKTTLGLNLNYFWTKNEYSNFYLSKYLQISMMIGFKHVKSTKVKEKE